MKVNATVSEIIKVLQQVESRCGKDTPIIVNEIMGDLHPLFNIYLNNSEGNSEAQVLLEFDREDTRPTIDKKVNCFSDSGKFFVENQVQVTKVYMVEDLLPMGAEQFLQYCKDHIFDIFMEDVKQWATKTWFDRLAELMEDNSTMTLEEALLVCNTLMLEVNVEEIY